MIVTATTIRFFRPEDQPWFESLNRAWIEQFFEMEPLDIAVLQNPGKLILDSGGQILMAETGNRIVGTVALKYVTEGIFEMTKMAVAEEFRGKKIGFSLVNAALDLAKNLGAKKVILYSSTRLKPAIALYRKIGFIEAPVDPVYKRSDIKMEINI